MRWFEKLPTLSGVGRFIYILTNYKTISGDIEEYRRQIKDREDWARWWRSSTARSYLPGWFLESQMCPENCFSAHWDHCLAGWS